MMKVNRGELLKNVVFVPAAAFVAHRGSRARLLCVPDLSFAKTPTHNRQGARSETLAGTDKPR